MNIRDITSEEYKYWMEVSTLEQANDRAFANQSSVEEELANLKIITPKLLTDGMNTKNHYFHILEENQKDIGFIWFGELPGLPSKTTFLLDIIIREEYRGKGYGRYLLSSMHAVLKQYGYQKVMLNVLKKNYAKNLYASLGYEVIEDKPYNLTMSLEL